MNRSRRGSRGPMDQLNETPVTYAVLLIYLTMAYLTRSMGMAEIEFNAHIKYGAAAGMLIQDGEYWRLLSHAFLHGGLLHLALNSYALLIVGPTLEHYFRTWRFILLYVVSAVTGCLFALAVNHHFLTLVGGSGALFGMLGAALAVQVRGGRTTLDFLENQGSRRLIAIILLNLVIGFFIPVVSNSAHVGGLVAGFVLVYCFLDTGRRGGIDRTGRAIQVGWIAVLLALLLYQANPVLRYDFQVKQFLLERDPTRKEHLRLLVRNEGFFAIDEALEDEQEPRTGEIGIAGMEFFYEKLLGVHEFSRALQRWKEASVR